MRPAQADPGSVVLVVVTVGPAVVEVVPSTDVVVVVSAARVVGGLDVVVVPQADSSTWQPAQSAQAGLRFGRAVPAAQIVAVRPSFVGGQSQASPHSGWYTPSPQ